MTQAKVSRSLEEMIHALRKHLTILDDHSHKVFVEGSESYAGEIAGKLRLLVTTFRSNVPLLIQLMERTNVDIRITLDGPPILICEEGIRGGDSITLQQYLNLDALGMRTPAGEFATFTKTQLIRVWAEQTGSSHEDWSISEGLQTAMEAPIYFYGLQASLMELKLITEVVLDVARIFLKKIDDGEVTSFSAPPPTPATSLSSSP